MCINGAGILNKWMKQISGNRMGYDEMNQMASKIQPGSEGLHFFPFGNGTERMLGNQLLHAHIQQIDFNRHTPAHLFRAAQEGVAFAFRYGLDLLREMKVETEMIRAGRANLFLSEVFVEAFVQLTQTPLELIDTNGSVGAAMGAARGSGNFSPVKDSKFSESYYRKIDPDKNVVRWEELYQEWLCELNNKIKN
jgi:xylulokinase